MTTVTPPREVVQQALRRAYNLGQTYWQQADSESDFQNRKSDATAATFKQLIVDTCNALDAPAKPVDCRGCKNLITHNELCRLTLAPVTSPKPCTDFDKFQALPPISLTRVTK